MLQYRIPGTRGECFTLPEGIPGTHGKSLTLQDGIAGTCGGPLTLQEGIPGTNGESLNLQDGIPGTVGSLLLCVADFCTWRTVRWRAVAARLAWHTHVNATLSILFFVVCDRPARGQAARYCLFVLLVVYRIGFMPIG